MNQRTCIVCSKSNSSYRCPKCRACYCSKDCCKTHQENDCPHFKDSRASAVPKKSSQLEETIIIGGFEKDNATNIVEKSEIKPEETETTSNTMSISPSPAVIELQPKLPTIDDRIIQLTEDQKLNLSRSKLMRDLMGSKRLRDEFEKIDTAPNRAEVMKKLRTNNSEFNVIMEKLLNVVSGKIDK